MRGHLRLLSLLVLAMGAGCAAPAKMTFSEAGLGPEDGGSLSRGDGQPQDDGAAGAEPDDPSPPSSNPAPEKLATEEVTGPAIDAILLAFAAQAREARATLGASRGFPPVRVEAWDALARQLDRYLTRGMSQTPLSELVRARVTLEAELDFDARRYGQPPPALAALLADKVAHLARRATAARALGQTMFAASGPTPELHWPIADADLSSTFGPRLHPIDHVRKMHWGIDLAAAQGRVVTSAADGYVVHAGYRLGYGLVVEVRHGGDLTSRYGHLSRLLCAAGDRVEVGQPLGLVGATGHATGPHLHFEVWRGGRAQDPLALLGGRWTRADEAAP
jgi:murein DD-endopeptidase MepM/ murein hydrolase activator NlpD